MIEPDETHVRRCICCQRTELDAVTLATCLDCLSATRRNLADIVEAYALLPTLLGHPKSPSLADSGRPGGDELPLPGGDALVMLAGGSAASERLRAFMRGEDDAWDQDDRAGDVPSVAYELSRWEDDMRREFGHPAAVEQATVVGSARYLMDHMSHAAQHHPAFDEFAADVRRLRGALTARTGTSDRPETGAPCLDCGVPLERRWTDEGLSDDWTCRVCHRRLLPEEYALAIRAALEDSQGGPSTADTLTTALGVTGVQLRQWAARGHIRKLGKDSRGRTLYDAAEVRGRAMREAG